MKLTYDDDFLDAADEAVARMLRSGLPAPKQPMAADGRHMLDPDLPDDLSKATYERLGKLMGQLVSCANYATYIAALNDVQFVIAENQLEFLSAQKRLLATGNTTAKRDKAKVDLEVRQANTHYLETMAKAKLTAALLENYTRKIHAVSREITRRSNEMDRAKKKIDE